MYTEEQLEQIADEAARILVREGHAIERRSGGHPVHVYTKPDATLIKAILSAAMAVKYEPVYGPVLDPPPKYGDDSIADMEYE